MAASLSDILANIQNTNVALSQISNTLLRYFGNVTSSVISAADGRTAVYTGAGYLVSMSVTVAGSAAGTIYNAANTEVVAATNVLCVVPATAQITRIGMFFNSGLVITPGTGQSLCVTYYLGK